MKRGLFHKGIPVLLVLLILFSFGCTKKTGNDYAEKATEFYSKLITYDAKINRIDAKDKDACEDLLNILDDMDKEFKDFAAIPVPNDVPDAKEHVDNASKFMSEAVSYYHVALEGEEVDEMALSNAKLSYGNAITEIKNVGVALQNSGK